MFFIVPKVQQAGFGEFIQEPIDAFTSDGRKCPFGIFPYLNKPINSSSLRAAFPADHPADYRKVHVFINHHSPYDFIMTVNKYNIYLCRFKWQFVFGGNYELE